MYFRFSAFSIYVSFTALFSCFHGKLSEWNSVGVQEERNSVFQQLRCLIQASEDDQKSERQAVQNKDPPEKFVRHNVHKVTAYNAQVSRRGMRLVLTVQFFSNWRFLLVHFADTGTASVAVFIMTEMSDKERGCGPSK